MCVPVQSDASSASQAITFLREAFLTLATLKPLFNAMRPSEAAGACKFTRARTREHTHASIHTRAYTRTHTLGCELTWVAGLQQT